MATEDLTGTNKFVNHLVVTNPVSNDGLINSDEHHRGVKQVIVNCFPNITGPVTSTQGRLNDVPIPNLVYMLFHEVVVPTGWVLYTALNDRVLMLSSTAAGGRTSAGSWSISGMTAAASTTGVSGAAHTHVAPASTTGVSNSNTTFGASGLTSPSPGNMNVPTISHSHSQTAVTTSTGSANHSHTQTAVNVTGSSWRPAYTNVILCYKATVT